MRILVALVLAVPSIGFAQTSREQPSAVWDVADVNRYIAAQRATASTEAETDPFAAPNAVERPTSMVLSLTLERDLNRPEQNYRPTWRYDPVAKKLTLFVSADVGTLVNWDYGSAEIPPLVRLARPGGFATDVQRTEAPGGARQNSYGAVVDVVTIRESVQGVMMRGSEVGVSPLPRAPNFSYRHELAIEPEAARELVEHLRLKVRARPFAWTPGRFVLCGSRYHAATVVQPQELLADYCFITAYISSVSFVDNRDGHALREWTH